MHLPLGSVLLSLSLSMPLMVMPLRIEPLPDPQERAEQVVRKFLEPHGPYMAIYFSEVDTAFTELRDETGYQDLTRQVQAYQDSTALFSHVSIEKADSFFSVYKRLSLKKDSMRIHYKPRPLGWFIIHHFQLDGKPWTDSFMIDFNFSAILKARQAIE